MSDYINIHTHTLGVAEGIAIVNLFPENAEKIISENPNLLFSIGLHPCFINKDAGLLLQEIEKLATHKQVLAIGEIGLDKRTETSLAEQTEIFRTQIRIAEKVQKPIIIHCVKAFQEILAIKKELKPSVPFVFHGFRGKPELAKQLLKENCYISIGKHATQIPETVLVIPTDRLLLETDESEINIKSLYQLVAEIKNITEKELLKHILENFKQLTKSK